MARAKKKDFREIAAVLKEHQAPAALCVDLARVFQVSDSSFRVDWFLADCGVTSDDRP